MPAPRKHRRPRRPLKEAPEKPSSPKAWLIALIVFSLLAHVLVLMAFVFVGRHTPKWPELKKDEPPPEVTLTLAPPPAQPMKPDFIPTEPQQGTPPQQSPLISDNDNTLKSQNQKSRAPDSLMPDVTGHKDHSFDLHSQSPSKLSKAQQPTPPTPQKQQQQQPPQKTVAQTKQAPKQAPPDPSAIHPTDNPEKGQDTMVAKYKPEDQQVDDNGLPVLPPITAPTLAQQTPQTQPIPQIQRQASPQSVPSFAVYQSDVAGQHGAPGDNSPSAMATDLGRYKAKVYRAVGALWYNKVNSQLQVLGVGTVHITYTIYSDGHVVITGDPDAGNPALMLLHSLSLNSITEAAPFDAFTDKMKKEVGDSYTDDFSFSIYGD